MNRRAVFLDRDGVINKVVMRDGIQDSPRHGGELVIIDGVEEAICMLSKQGFLVIIVTNQPGVKRGTHRKQDVEEIHKFIGNYLMIDGIYTCYHDNEDNCACRKPKAGMLYDAAENIEIDLGSSYMIGDRWQDICAGNNAGCKTILVDYHYPMNKDSCPDHRTGSLLEAAQWILLRERK